MKTFKDLKRSLGHSLGPVRRGVAMTVAAGKMAGTDDPTRKENYKKFIKRLAKKDPPKFSFSEALALNRSREQLHDRLADKKARKLKHQNRVSDDEEEAIHQFQDMDHSDIHHVMTAIQKNKLARNQVVFHGTQDNPKNLPKNDNGHHVWKSKGFLHSSLSREVARNFSHGLGGKEETHVLKIHVPKGSHHSMGRNPDFEHEREMFFAPHHEIHIHPEPSVRVDKDGTKHHIWNAHLTHDGIEKTEMKPYKQLKEDWKRALKVGGATVAASAAAGAYGKGFGGGALHGAAVGGLIGAAYYALSGNLRKDWNHKVHMRKKVRRKVYNEQQNRH